MPIMEKKSKKIHIEYADNCAMGNDILLALSAFAFVTSITPGPNNLMLMASGANFGFRRTVPHLLGVVSGFFVLIVLVGVGLIRVFDLVPASYLALQIVSVCYLVYLASKIAMHPVPFRVVGRAGRSPSSRRRCFSGSIPRPGRWRFPR